MNDVLKQKLADLKARQESGEHMVCPRCGLDRMKPELYTNALSREAGNAGIMVCDQCGTEEAMLAFMQNPKPLTSWACFQPERPAGDFKAVSGAEAWEEIRNTQLPILSQLFERWQEEKGNADFEAYRLSALQKCNKAFWNQLRGRTSYEVRNALQVGELAEGGYTVPDEFEHQLIEALQDENIMRGMVHVITTSSGDRKIPLVTNYGNASWIEEEAQIPESDVAFNQITLGAHKLATAIRISQELLNDSAFDLASFIVHEFQRRAGAAEEEAIISGDGSHKPIGLLHDSLGAQVGVTAASATAITTDELIDLQHSLKSGYRRKASFIMNDAVIKAIRKLKDGQGQYLWQPSIREGVPDMILNTRVYVSNYMPLVEAGKKVILYGDYSYYWLADRAGRTLQRLNELYAMTDQVGFKLTERLDGRLILPEAVKVLQMKAA